MIFETHTLKNGIRLIHKHVVSKVAHCGIIINTGSRDEKENESGIAHFIEHVIFKGTGKRRAYHILNRMEDVGGEINAYTTKEETCIYATFLEQDYDRALELISDITFNSVFPEKELEKEKEVVLDEINSYKDSPSELIFDDFEELIFENDPIGRNILGTEDMVKKYTIKDIKTFIENNYHTDQMVISSVGNIPFDKLVKKFEKYYGSIEASFRESKRIKPRNYTPKKKTIIKDTYQAHCIIGCETYDLNEPRRIVLALLVNILGGPGLNSRLNMSLREKHGLAYNIECSYSPYVDTGVLNIYFGTDKDKLNKCLKLIYREIDILTAKPMGEQKLKKAKKQMIGQMAISSENNENLMLTIAKSYLLYNKVESLDSLFEKIEAVSVEDLQQVAIDVLKKENLSILIYK